MQHLLKLFHFHQPTAEQFQKTATLLSQVFVRLHQAVEKLKIQRLLFIERDRFISLAIENSDAGEDRYDKQFGREPDQTLSVAV